MIHKVLITPVAEEGLGEAYLFVRRDSLQAARRWSRGARRAIRRLSGFPERCPIAPESREFDRPIRELLYGSGNRGTYRILFTIIDRTVFVLHVRHGSMPPLLAED